MIKVIAAELDTLQKFKPRKGHEIENDVFEMLGRIPIFAFVCRDTEETLSIFGLTPTSEGIAELWQIPGENYNKYKFSLYKSTLYFIYGEIKKNYDKLIVTISEDDGYMGAKWAIMLGGRPYINLPKFRKGKDHTLFIIDLKDEEA